MRSAPDQFGLISAGDSRLYAFRARLSQALNAAAAGLTMVAPRKPAQYQPSQE